MICGACGDPTGPPVEIVDQVAAVVSTPTESGSEPPQPIGIEFEVVIRKTGEHRLGLDISEVDGKALKVWKVKPGLISEWNKSKTADMQVRAGDSMIAVNGKRGSIEDLLDLIAGSTEEEDVSLLFTRGTT
eukprot:TRINITY_DN43143_c0_g1_i1.p1 TRINITY_DN43143_c0_g1~~TRINITY_DN43143_c0_g1_i1.p1  ORF type:complete len:131 (-),score=25.22 TRINITY_DN43143_c0_g1_i1:137-529(-)